MKASLQFDPIVDVMGNRLPNVFVQHRETGEKIFTELIERLARGLGTDGALVIFPEGANWTPSRWRRGIRRLELAGDRGPGRPGPGDAQRAAATAGRGAGGHRRPPRRGRDLRGARRAGDHLVHQRHLGRFPVDQVIKARWWRVPFDQVPRTAAYEAQVQWLYDWWERIDTLDLREPPRRYAGPAAVLAPEDGPAGAASDWPRPGPRPC